ncbi:hypothetical protein SLEP1_g38397 [Rubroshorea leprosula]|nr:hypothetical protein SLEP1_g38397 [Rubroshorea leprosula]
MMPFGLKNACATYQNTYQKLVTIVFRAQIDRNLEVYVDDIVVKSLKTEDHLTDLKETFNNLRQNRMQLNLAKCIFGVESRKFLGFMVSRRGIEVNPKKIKAIAEMEPPKLVKDIQRLIGRVAAFHRFISKSANKCLPFFKIMRSAAQKDEFGKQKKFEWNSECQAAFDEQKSYLTSPPLLRKAIDGEILYLYLGILDEAINSVLVREKGKQQKPVYYTSSVLCGAELRYPIAEKAALAVILQKPECLGRLIKWAMELGEFEILYVDGASSSKGLGASAFLVGPDEYRSEHALKFNFDATNNMAEYEALLLGLQLALELKVTAIQVYSDSQLMVNQINSIARSVFVEVLDEPSFIKPKMMEISTNSNTLSWTTPIISFLQDGCLKCQFFAHLTHQPVEKLTKLVVLWPFAQWGLDLLGPFMKGIGGVTHLIVSVDYFTNWVEARPLSSLISRKVKDFVFSSIICRYGISNQIVADNGTQFNCSSLRDFCSNYGVKLQFTLVYHLESNGMVESVNKAILEGIKPRLEQYKAREVINSWLIKLGWPNKEACVGWRVQEASAVTANIAQKIASTAQKPTPITCQHTTH